MTVRRLILLFFSDNKKAMANIATAPSSPQTIFNESTSKILFKKVFIKITIFIFAVYKFFILPKPRRNKKETPFGASD